MKILWMTWKDLSHPQAGGAESINEEIAKRLARDGHEVVLLTSGFPGAESTKTKDGYKIVRMGNRYTVYWCAYRYYKKNLIGWADLVIDEMNTMPFFCKYYAREKNIMFVHQLCREIWFYQLSWPLNLIGYLLEPIYLWLLRDRYVITVSESTRQDLRRYGFQEPKISIIPEGIATQPINTLAEVEKFLHPTLLSLGAIRAMKRTAHQIQAFEIAKKQLPDLQLKIAGGVSDRYGKKLLGKIAASKYKKDIEYLGRVGEAKKTELMQKSHFILVTSVKEGWGLIVTEANSRGTPAIVYDVDGLRDSVKKGMTGFICPTNTPESMAAELTAAFADKQNYVQIQENAWQWSRELTLENCYRAFLQVVETAHIGDRTRL